MFISLKSSFSRVLSRIDKNNRVYNLNAGDVFIRVLKDVFDDNITDYIKSARYDNGCLFLKCANSSVASEINLRNNLIINAANNRLAPLNKGVVKRIIFA